MYEPQKWPGLDGSNKNVKFSINRWKKAEILVLCHPSNTQHTTPQDVQYNQEALKIATHLNTTVITPQTHAVFITQY